MKKTLNFILTLALTMSSVAAFSQEEAAAPAQLKAIPEGYLPVAGDIAFGISANPLLDYAGNLLNGNTNNTLSGFGGEPIMTNFSFGMLAPTVSIMGKYMLEDNKAVIANIGIIGVSMNGSDYVQDDKAVALDPLSQDQVVDNVKMKASGASIALGLEWNRTYRKIRGFGGASLMYAFVKESTTYTYGNAITDINQTPSTADIFAYAPVGFLPSARMLEESNVDNTTAVGLVGHVGVEWFFAPKVSIGGQVNLSFVEVFTPQIVAKYEGYSAITSQKETYTELVSPATNGFIFGTENLGANVFINFYF